MRASKRLLCSATSKLDVTCVKCGYELIAVFFSLAPIRVAIKALSPLGLETAIHASLRSSFNVGAL